MKEGSVVMEGTGAWILGGLIAMLGLIGLYFASHAVDGAIYYTGLLVFVFSVLFVMAQVKHHFDQEEK
jgi:UDP-N-acetylmuramyl pentapeptide phosphotransferase/UDP-N-acetylglucosamine-1-phosphate transferase